MSGNIYIEIAQVIAKRSLQSEFIVTLHDGYGRDFFEVSWKKIPDSDLEILAECCQHFNENDEMRESAGGQMIDHRKDYEKGFEQ